MSAYLLYNGKFHKEDSPLVTASNRGLRYGDGLFETLRCTDGQLQMASFHFERLFNGLQLLQFDCPAYFTPAYLQNQVIALCYKNQHPVARVRINVFRGDGGLYDAENHFPHYIIQSWKLPEPGFQFNENGLVTGIYPDAQKPMDLFCNLKCNSFLPYTMAALHAQKNRWNDAILLNTAGRVCDTSIANLFIIKNEIIYTSPLTEASVAGTMRRFLLENLPANGFSVQEKPITEADLYSADEVFLSNAIKGIRWVGHCGDSTYNWPLTKAIFHKMLKK